MCLSPEGHSVVLGTAGSGKTTMALHRAAFLANPSTDHGGRTLLVTFNRTLVTYLNHLCPAELANVDVRNYHRFARGYLASRGRMSHNCIVDNGYRQHALIQEALDAVRSRHQASALLRREPEFFVSEIRWMSQHGITDKRSYLQADRLGRAEARLTREQRPRMFEVYGEYLALRERDGKWYDWDDLAVAVHRELLQDASERMYRHVVIDEGQDFSPEMIRSLVAAVPPDGSITFFGDVAQQIYGRRMSWRDSGLEVDAVWRFRKNYRNSPEVAALGLAIADMPYFEDLPDMVAPDEFAAAGPLPTLVRFDSVTDEVDFVVEQAREASQAGSVGVLARTHGQERLFQGKWRGAQYMHSQMRSWRPGPGISYGTVHSAKGLEFDTVIVPRLGADCWPDPQVVAGEGEDEAAADDGRLLYVAVTRARQGLILTCTGEPTELLPENDELWVEIEP